MSIAQIPPANVLVTPSQVKYQVNTDGYSNLSQVNQSVQQFVQSQQLREPAPVNNGNISSEPKLELNADSDYLKDSRTMSHVVEVYNQQGNVRIKFMDGNNNVIYQIPSEMVAKIKDQMMQPETSTSIKG